MLRLPRRPLPGRHTGQPMPSFPYPPPQTACPRVAIHPCTRIPCPRPTALAQRNIVAGAAVVSHSPVRAHAHVATTARPGQPASQPVSLMFGPFRPILFCNVAGSGWPWAFPSLPSLATHPKPHARVPSQLWCPHAIFLQHKASIVCAVAAQHSQPGRSASLGQPGPPPTVPRLKASWLA